ncbi:nitroreductase family protein [Candidatus Pacearchaeota archaeon]|nr:nitroreductase family protein [Candidatus Pacearchaeota archaeon]
MDLDKIIKNRRSVRKFKSKKPDWRDILDCIDSMRHTPMAGGNFTLKFILVDDKEKIEKLSEAAQQDFISQAQYVLVVCSNPSRTVNAYEKRGETYCRHQAGAAIQTLLLKITEAGLATCWVGHFIDEQVKRILRIPENINVEAMFPIGYELKKPVTRKVKSDLDTALYFNEYKNKKMRKIRKLEGKRTGRLKDKK